MGHSNTATTAEFYNQVDADHEAKAAEVIQGLIENANNKVRSKKTDIGGHFTPNWGKKLDANRRASTYNFIPYENGRYRT